MEQLYSTLQQVHIKIVLSYIYIYIYIYIPSPQNVHSLVSEILLVCQRSFRFQASVEPWMLPSNEGPDTTNSPLWEDRALVEAGQVGPKTSCTP